MSRDPLLFITQSLKPRAQDVQVLERVLRGPPFCEPRRLAQVSTSFWGQLSTLPMISKALKPKTLNPNAQTLNPKSQTQNPKA